MLKKIEISALGIGMYVVLPLAWYEHTFLKNHFKIVSECRPPVHYPWPKYCSNDHMDMTCMN